MNEVPTTCLLCLIICLSRLVFKKGFNFLLFAFSIRLLNKFPAANLKPLGHLNSLSII